MTSPPAITPSSCLLAAVAVVVVSGLAGLVGAQGSPATLVLLSKEGRRTITVTASGGVELVALDDLAAAFQLTVREDAGAVTASYKGKTIVLTPDQALASVAGRLVSLPAPPARLAGRLYVPLDFIPRALAPIYDIRLDLRRTNHLLVIGDLRVPKLTLRYDPLANGVRLTLEATPRAGINVSQDNQRLLLRVDADALDVSIPPIQPQGPQGFVQAVRAADTTIVVEAGPRFGTYRASAESLENTTRLTLDVLALQAEPSAQPASPLPEPPALTSTTPTIRTIVIDPGHGGEDTGVKGAGGTVEKILTLTIARRLKAAIEARLGIRVLLARDDDKNIPLDDRTATANNNKADLFISLHANASPSRAARGATLYVASLPDEQQAHAALVPERVPVVGGGLRDIEIVQWDVAQVRHLDRSAALAQVLEAHLSPHMPMSSPAIDRAPLRVLEPANMPAVLIELGYLSNPEQEKALAGADFQGAFVQAVSDAVVQFRNDLPALIGTGK